MNCNEYVELIKRKNPSLFKADKIALTPDKLEVVIRMAFETGRASVPKPPTALFDLLFGEGL